MNEQGKKILPFDSASIFEIDSETQFNECALALFRYQFANNSIYRSYCEHLNIQLDEVKHYTAIPFLPISFFKTHSIIAFDEKPEITFSSSGTTGMQLSKHHVKEVDLYTQSFTKGFEYRYGSIENYLVLGLLPSYLEREGFISYLHV